ncbi:MAG: DUF6475 domain-containing protein [Betaproteobacteria bacterium]
MGNLQTMVVVDSLPKRSSAETIWEAAGNSANGMNKAAFVELMNGLWAGMGRAVMPDKITLRVWYLCLHDLTEAQFGRGIQRYLQERSDEFVSVKIIRELSGVQATGETQAIAAWDDVVREINRVGAYQTPRFRDVRTTAVIQHLGGWIRVCDTKPDELHKWTRQHFLRTFAAMPATAAARLTNLVETENARTGQTEAAETVQRKIQADQRLRIA